MPRVINRMRLAMFFGTLLLLMATAVTPGAVAATGTVEPVFDYAPPFLPEGIALDKTGNIYVSLANQSEIRKIERDGTESAVAVLPTGGFGLLGLAVDAPGTVYAALASIDPTTQGVYRVDSQGVAERIPGSEQLAVPNALAFDKRGNIFVTETIAGQVWKIGRNGGATLWVESDLLQGDGSFSFGVPIGANGIAYHKKNVYVANTEIGTIVQIPVRKDGSAGEPTVIVDQLVGADGIAFDVKGNLYVVRVIGNELVRINLRNGQRSILADGAGGLDGPASLAFGTGQGSRKYVYIANFTLGNDNVPTPGVVRVDVGVPGVPLP